MSVPLVRVGSSSSASACGRHLAHLPIRAVFRSRSRSVSLIIPKRAVSEWNTRRLRYSSIMACFDGVGNIWLSHCVQRPTGINSRISGHKCYAPLIPSSGDHGGTRMAGEATLWSAKIVFSIECIQSRRAHNWRISAYQGNHWSYCDIVHGNSWRRPMSKWSSQSVMSTTWSSIMHAKNLGRNFSYPNILTSDSSK